MANWRKGSDVIYLRTFALTRSKVFIESCMAHIILLHQWQLWRMAEEKRLERLLETVKEVYKVTSGAPMDSLIRKCERLDRVHELVHGVLTDEEKLGCFDKKHIDFAVMLKRNYTDPQHGPWLDADCMRTTREICDMVERREQ